MFHSFDLPGPIGDVQKSLEQLMQVLSILNPLNWPSLIRGETESNFRSVLNMMLNPERDIVSSAKYMEFLRYFIALGIVLWVAEVIYRAIMAGKGEPGHGSEFVKSSVWIWTIVPSLPALLMFGQLLMIGLGKLFAEVFMGGTDIRSGLNALISVDGLPAFIAGVATGIQFILVGIIALELVATQLLLPIAGLLLVVAFGIRWMGNHGEAVYRASVYSTLLALGTASIMVVWFAALIAFANIVFNQNPFARSAAGMIGLIGAVTFFWPFKKWFDAKIAPKLHMPDSYNNGGTGVDGLSDPYAPSSSEVTQKSYDDAQTAAAAQTATPSHHEPGASTPQYYEQQGIEAAIRSLIPIVHEGAAAQAAAADRMMHLTWHMEAARESGGNGSHSDNPEPSGFPYASDDPAGRSSPPLVSVPDQEPSKEVK